MNNSNEQNAAYAGVVGRILSQQYVDGIWKLARKVLHRTDSPDMFPRYTIPGLPYYVYHDSSFWTSGFFPGSVWALYERSLKMPLSVPSPKLLAAAKKWQIELAKEQFKTDNHDLGFMIMPSFRRDYELTGCRESLEVVINAARSLATRYNPTTGVIRSWAGARTKEYDLNQKDIDYVVVMDGMMNLDLLYFAAQHSGETRLADIATAHAETTLKNHIRSDWSSYHVVNYDIRDGSIRNRLTCQGYDHESTWARGQAWALYGYASVYQWTREDRFLQTSSNLIDYFLSRVDENDNIVYWDFDAPRPGVWDVSAATIGCSGILLLLQQATLGADKSAYYLKRVLQILDVVMRDATDPDSDALFDKSTSNDHRHALQRTAHHGSSYADYYFLECGNRLKDLGWEPVEETAAEQRILS